MKKQALNPYLPFWETVPDGEPHVFGDRLYIYGSHDKLRGETFCEDDYVCWSAPVDDLGNWKYEGVIYKKEQDPINGAPYDQAIPEYTSFEDMDIHCLYAPDVAQGRDGRYYLYYALDFCGIVSVAVSDRPEGPYEFYGYVTKEDGTKPFVGNWFDPGVLCEESGIYLYVGFCPAFKFPGMEGIVFPGSMMVKLADDMKTIISEPVCVANGIDTAKGTDYEAHPFFEASSIRHFGDWYYFVYSSMQGNELCYGMSKTPEGPFEYKGVLHSNGDLGYKGNDLATNYTGNNHGGLVQVNGKTYIFGHRHSHGTQFSRQGVAEEVQILEDGTIPQVEMTSCGLNGGPLTAKGEYLTYIACHLVEENRENVGIAIMSGPGEPLPEIPKERPYVTEESDEQGEKGYKPFIKNMQKGAVAGFKYFSFDGTESEISVEIRGTGTMEVYLDDAYGCLEAYASMAISSEDWTSVKASFAGVTGVHALYFKVSEGAMDFAKFEIY